MHVSIQLFQNDRDNHFFIPNRPAENSFVKVEISPLEEKKILLEKRIYVESSFKFTGIRNTSTYSISFVNQYSNDLYVSVDLERQQSTPNIVNSSTMDPIVGKAKHTLDEIQVPLSNSGPNCGKAPDLQERDRLHVEGGGASGLDVVVRGGGATVAYYCSNGADVLPA